MGICSPFRPKGDAGGQRTSDSEGRGGRQAYPNAHPVVQHMRSLQFVNTERGAASHNTNAGCEADAFTCMEKTTALGESIW